MPADAYLFRPTVGCPPGWELATTIGGRFVVALPYEGQAGATFGGNSIGADATQPTHTHTFLGEMTLPDTSIGLASGCCAGGYAATGTYPFEGTSSLDALGLPFLMTPFCQKTAALIDAERERP